MIRTRSKTPFRASFLSAFFGYLFSNVYSSVRKPHRTSKDGRQSARTFCVLHKKSFTPFSHRAPAARRTKKRPGGAQKESVRGGERTCGRTQGGAKKRAEGKAGERVRRAERKGAQSRAGARGRTGGQAGRKTRGKGKDVRRVNVASGKRSDAAARKTPPGGCPGGVRLPVGRGVLFFHGGVRLPVGGGSSFSQNKGCRLRRAAVFA